ncbi:MAG: basic amino acid/polyamine antiporter [Gammaproteobacteria bacterium]|nr:basic amino acid/polyamine antiporter [Gammaproteobacteria bacterium]
MANQGPNKIGIFSLMAIIVGSMIGGGAFSLPTDMARHAGLVAILLAWLITGVGMVCLALVYQNLSRRKPELSGGIYSYASAGFGRFIGFNSAWGYWLSAFLGNVAYALLLFNALSFFFPVFEGNNNAYVLLGASVILWGVHAIALKGVKQAAIINIITTIARLVPIFAFILILLFAFNVKHLSFQALGSADMGSVLKQLTSTMMVTLWVFIGIEGAVVISGRARKTSDVGKATVIGLCFTLFVYILLNIVTLAAVPREVLMQFENPTLAYALEYIVGPWGAWFVNIGLCIALFGALLSWTLLASETPYIAAKDGVMPKIFAKENKHKAPNVSLWITNGAVQVFLFIAYLSSGTYKAIYMIAAVAILPPYLFSGLYALKIALKKDGYAASENSKRDLILAFIASFYGLWLIYAANIQLLLLCAILYFVGLFVYIYACLQSKHQWFTHLDRLWVILITLAAMAGGWLLWSGSIRL